MSSDGVTPNPGDQQQPDPAAVAAAAQAAGAQPTAGTEDVDIDEQAVIEATRAAEAEEAAAAGTDKSQAQPGQAPGAQPAAGQGQQDQQPSGDVLQIPKPRFDEVAAQRDKALQGEAYWRGVAEARGTQTPGQPGQAPAAQQPAAQPAPDARLVEIKSLKLALAKKFDDGEITYADLTAQTDALADKEQQIREEMLVAKVRPADAPAKAGNDELYLNTLTADLEEKHPWVKVFDKAGTDIDWKFLRDTAVQNLLDRGVDATKGTLGTYELRKEMAVLADKYGPAMVGEKAKAKNVAIPGQTQDAGGTQPQPNQQQQQPAKPPLSPVALVRSQKLDVAANQPPNVAAMSGHNGDAGGSLTDSQIEGLSEDQFDALPEAQRNTLLGIA